MTTLPDPSDQKKQPDAKQLFVWFAAFIVFIIVLVLTFFYRSTVELDVLRGTGVHLRRATAYCTPDRRLEKIGYRRFSCHCRLSSRSSWNAKPSG